MSRVLSFIIGAYAGVFVAQNTELPRVPGPIFLVDKVKELLSNEPEKNAKKGK